MDRLKATVKGRVQGVGFRYFVRTAAQELKLSGYVKNLPTGDVEVVAEGDEDAIEEMRMRLWKGPAFSNVVDISEDVSQVDGEYNGFEVRR